MVKSELRVCPNSVVDQTYEQLLVNRDILFPLKNELAASILNGLFSNMHENYPPSELLPQL